MCCGVVQGLPPNPTDLKAKPGKEDEKWERFCPLKCKSDYAPLVRPYDRSLPGDAKVASIEYHVF